MKKSSLLQKVDDDRDKRSSGSVFKIIFYLIILGIAFYFGESLMRQSKPESKESSSLPATATAQVPSQITAEPSAAPVIHSAAATPAQSPITEAVSPPAVPMPTLHDEHMLPAAPSVTAAPLTFPETVTITEAIEVPMKHGGSVVGYINLQPGQQIKPYSMDDKQLMVRFGDNTGSIPINSTSLKR
jgi:hypothetical protein